MQIDLHGLHEIRCCCIVEGYRLVKKIMNYEIALHTYVIFNFNIIDLSIGCCLKPLFTMQTSYRLDKIFIEIDRLDAKFL